MTDLGMNEVFVINVIDLLGLNDFSFIKKFEGNILSSLFVLGDFDFTKSSLSKNSSDFIVFKLEFLDILTLSFLHIIFLNVL